MKRRTLYISCFFIFICATLQLCAQNFPVKHFTPSDGLSHDNVYRIFQDRRGFMWFGTEYGVSRFDGRKFTNYAGTQAISLGTVTYIGETGDNDKWICTYSGNIDVIHSDSLRRVRFAGDTGINSVVQCLMDGTTTWIIDKSGMLFRFKDRHITSLRVNSGMRKFPRFRKIIRMASGQVVLASDNGLYRWNNNDLIEPYLEQDIREKVYALSVLPGGSLWLGLANRIVQVSENTIKHEYKTGSQNEISDLLIDHKGNVWAAIPDVGVLLLHDGRFSNITRELNLQNILINDLYEDKNHNIWIATHGSGLYCISNMNILNYPAEQGKVNNYATSMINYKGKIYIGSIGTISVCKGDDIQRMKSNLLSPSDYIYFIKGIEDRLYIGTPKGILVKKTGDWKNEYFITTNGATSMNTDALHRTWISRYGDVGILDGKDYRMNVVLSQAVNSRVNDMVQSKDGTTWLASASGLFYMDPSVGKTLKVPSITHGVSHIMTDSRGRLWAASSWGLYMMTGRRLVHFTTAEGLSHNLVNALAEDSKGNIWIATLGGLDCYNGKSFRHYNDRSGLISNEILSVAADGQQRIWAGTVNGVSCIKNADSDTTLPPLQVYMTALHSGGYTYLFPQKVSVPYRGRNISIDLSAPDFPQSDKIEYQYTIEGSNNGWQPLSATSLEMPSLPGGQYTFKVRARRPGGAWSSSDFLQLSVATPFWQQAWFSVLMLLIISGAVFYFIRWRVGVNERRQKEEAAIHDKMIYLKQQALAALINPHFVFNCLNSIQSYMHMNDKVAANKFLVNFARLIRMTLDYAQEAFISLDMELERLELYLQLEKLRFGDKFEYNIMNQQSLATPELKIPNMILQPYVENAIKHGIIPKNTNGTINISVLAAGKDSLMITIEDDGVGLSHAQGTQKLHHSLGMKLTDDRLSLLQQMHNKLYQVNTLELTDEQGNASGTRVEILLSLDTEINNYSLAAI